MDLNLKIVTLNNYYENLQDSEIQKRFSDLNVVRSLGYNAEYPKRCIPFNETDFVVCHHLFYLEENGVSKPVAACKESCLSIYDRYQMEPHLLTMARKGGSADHVEALEALYDECRNSGQDIMYGAGFTILKEYRGRKELTTVIRELVAALVIQDMKEREIVQAITTAQPKFKMNLFFSKMGYEPLQWRGQILEPIDNPAGPGEKLMIMKAPKLSDWSMACYEKHRDFIEQRSFLGTPAEEQRLVA